MDQVINYDSIKYPKLASSVVIIGYEIWMSITNNLRTKIHPILSRDFFNYLTVRISNLINKLFKADKNYMKIIFIRLG